MEFIKKYKAQIISVLSALLTFFIAISQIDMGTKVGIVVSVLLVVLPVIISIISGDDMNKTITLLVNAITVIQQIVKSQKKAEKSEEVVGVGEDVLDLTEEEIKELITREV